MIQVARVLKTMAKDFNVATLVTNHVTRGGSSGGEVQPGLGVSWSHIPRTRILLERIEKAAVSHSSLRSATLIKSSRQPCHIKEEFDLQWWSRSEEGSSGKRKLDETDSWRERTIILCLKCLTKGKWMFLEQISKKMCFWTSKSTLLDHDSGNIFLWKALSIICCSISISLGILCEWEQRDYGPLWLLCLRFQPEISFYLLRRGCEYSVDIVSSRFGRSRASLCGFFSPSEDSNN